MQKLKKWALPALLLICFVGCKGGMISVDAIDGSVQKVSDRHDAYVNADLSLSADQKRTFLRTTELLRLVLEEAKKGK